MNNAINDIKNTLGGTNNRITDTEDRISEVEDRMVEINESERKKEKRIKRNEDNLGDLQDNIKCSNIRIIGVPEEEDKKKDHEKILEEIIVENFPKIGKEIATQVQETQRVPNRINPRRNTPRHILIKYWMLGAGALGRPRGMEWGGRREEGSGWGTHVYLWRIHFDIWQS